MFSSITDHPNSTSRLCAKERKGSRPQSRLILQQHQNNSLWNKSHPYSSYSSNNTSQKTFQPQEIFEKLYLQRMVFVLCSELFIVLRVSSHIKNCSLLFIFIVHTWFQFVPTGRVATAAKKNLDLESHSLVMVLIRIFTPIKLHHYYVDITMR